jgi:hypothetical protein
VLVGRSWRRGGKAKLCTTPPASVAWAATTKQAVFVYDTYDELVAEDIQGLCRTPEGVQGLLPPSGPLTAAWVPLTLLRDPKFRQQHLHHYKSGPLIQAALRLMDLKGGDRRDATDTHSMDCVSTGSPPRKECYDCKVIARPMFLRTACWLSGFPRVRRHLRGA